MKGVRQMLDDFLRTSEEYLMTHEALARGPQSIETCWTEPDNYTRVHSDYFDMHIQHVIEGHHPSRRKELEKF